MQRIQIARGDIKTRQTSLPLLAGEFFIDTSASTGYQLYIGTGGSGNYEWCEVPVADGTGVTIKGPDGAYKKIGAANALGFAETHNEQKTASYRVTTLPDSPVTGGVYIADADIQVDSSESAKFENLISDGADGYPEIKANDVLIYNGYKWVILGNSGGTAKTISFYPNYTQATSNATTIQDAIVALDSQKLAYKGVLFDGKNISTGTTLTLNEGTTLSFKEVLIEEDADGTTKTTPVADAVGKTDVELASVEGTVWSIGTECIINGESYEEGDFLAITATENWSTRTVDSSDVSSKKLSSSQVVLTKISGGTHQASKIYINGENLSRASTAGSIFTDTDKKIGNVEDALKEAWKSKADLDPTSGKVLLSQLPATIIGAMDYQGTYAGTTLPTASNKLANKDDTDASNPTLSLTKGDYWIYSSDTKWDITSLVTATSGSKITAAGTTEVDEKYYITNGDWLVYDGDDQWSVIDNTDAFNGVKVGETTLQGTVVIQGENRTTTEIAETEVSVDGQTITVKAPNAVIAEVGVSQNVIYKSDSADDRTAVASNLTDDGTDLTIKESEGVKLTTTVNSDGAEVTATIKGNDASTTLKLPNIDTTLAANEDLGIVDAADDNAGTKWFAAMYRNENTRKVIRDSFLQFLGDEDKTTGELALKGIELVDETLTNHKVDIKLSSDTGHTVQVLPRVSGYLLNTNSIIDCGVWTETSTDGTAPTEGYVSAEDGKLYKNQITYGTDDYVYQSHEEEADAKDLVTDSDKEEISAIIVND